MRISEHERREVRRKAFFPLARQPSDRSALPNAVNEKYSRRSRMRPAMSSILFACSLCLCTIAVNGSAADLYVPSQFPTIQAAIAQARIDRLSPNFPPDEIIIIHVGVGQYVE